MTDQAFPARIYVLLAREAAMGLIIRRGPSRQVCTIGWDRAADTFELGQWFRGRIYERRCDLAPDGRHLVYFALDGHWEAETKGAWTAVSRVPYPKAIALYPQGETGFGGGLFVDADTYRLNGAGPHDILSGAARPRRCPGRWEGGAFGTEAPSVYSPRLMRDGWQLVRHLRDRGEPLDAIFERPLAAGWTLRKLAHASVNHPRGTGCYWDEHVLVCAAGGREVAFLGWAWAEWDGQRLVWAAQGRLMAAELGPDGPVAPRLLADFNGLRFEARAAPY